MVLIVFYRFGLLAAMIILWFLLCFLTGLDYLHPWIYCGFYCVLQVWITCIMAVMWFLIRLCLAAVKVTRTMMVYIGIRLTDLLLRLHPPARERYRVKIIKRAHGANENTDNLIKNFWSWGTFVDLVRRSFKEAVYGSIKIGELIDADLLVHIVEDKKITRSCSILEFVKPGRLLVMSMGSAT